MWQDVQDVRRQQLLYGTSCVVQPVSQQQHYKNTTTLTMTSAFLLLLYPGQFLDTHHMYWVTLASRSGVVSLGARGSSRSLPSSSCWQNHCIAKGKVVGQVATLQHMQRMFIVQA